MIALTLPYPISANRYWRTVVNRKNGRAMTFVSAEASAYKTEVASIARLFGVRSPIAGPVSVDIELYPERPQDWKKRAQRDPLGWADSVRCIDLDNARKVLYDAMKGLVFDDDAWVHQDSGRRMEPDGKARVEVVIKRIVRVAPQLEMLA